jgi:hypothetical protein
MVPKNSQFEKTKKNSSERPVCTANQQPTTHTQHWSSMSLAAITEAVEHTSGREDIPESVYLNAMNSIKTLKDDEVAISKLYKVTYYEFYCDEDDTESMLRTRILEAKGPTYDDTKSWDYCFETNELPSNVDSMILCEPFKIDGDKKLYMVTKIEKYLKRGRE